MKRSFGSIKWKLVLVYAVLVVCVIFISGIYIIGTIQRNLYQSRYQELKYTAGRISDTLELAYTSSEQDLAEVFADVVMYISTFFSLISCVDYIVRNRDCLKDK